MNDPSANLPDRAAVLAAIGPFAPPWFAVWWGKHGALAKTLDEARWERIPYGPSFVRSLRRCARRQRYTMRRKLRKAFVNEKSMRFRAYL